MRTYQLVCHNTQLLKSCMCKTDRMRAMIQLQKEAKEYYYALSYHEPVGQEIKTLTLCFSLTISRRKKAAVHLIMHLFSLRGPGKLDEVCSLSVHTKAASESVAFFRLQMKEGSGLT